MKAALVWLALVAAVARADAQSTTPPPGFFDLPVAGGAALLAHHGISPAERAFTIPLIARRLHGPEPRVATQPAAVNDGKPVLIPAPLTAEAWQSLLRKSPLALSERLFADRRAMFLASGLIAADASIRQLALSDRDWLRRVYRESAGSFVVVAGSLRIENGRVVVPGGEAADQIWQNLVGTSPSRPAAFIRALMTKDDGRLAWYFDVLSRLGRTRFDAVWPPGPLAARLETARSLYAAFRNVENSWRTNEHPFRRHPGDPSIVLTQTALRGSTLLGPSSDRVMWTRLFENPLLERDDLRALYPRGEPVTLAWLAAMTSNADVPRERTDRFEMYRFAQRAFSSEDDVKNPVDFMIALGGYRRYKVVLLAMERMGIRSPATFATMVEAARAVDRSAGDRLQALSAFQGAFAIVDRMVQVGATDADGATGLLRALATAVQQEKRVTAAVGRWMRFTLLPDVTADFDGALITTLAGRERDGRRLDWEGLTYTISHLAAERERLRRMFAVIGLPGIANALASGRDADMARTLTIIAYGIALGDPAGPVTLAPEVATRHDFRAESTVDVRSWQPPNEVQAVHTPWHVQGSLIGLDLALARVALRHLAEDQLPSAPTLTTNDYATLARTTVSMASGTLADDDRDRIAAAIERGRQRVIAAGHEASALRALAHEVNVSTTTLQLLPWLLANTPEAVDSVFSLRDLLWLGEPDVAPERLNRWGMLTQSIDGSWRSAMGEPRPWEEFAGRSEVGAMMTQVPDLILRLVEGTATLKVPAALIPDMMRFAVQDVWYGTQTRFADDWPAMVKEPLRISIGRIEDYVAALAGSGPLRLSE
jgi:hypothetical protein